MRVALYTTTALLATTVIGKPAPASNTATCKLTYGSWYGEYDLTIGRPYDDGKGCKSIWVNFLDVGMNPLKGRKCENDGTGNTRLVFRQAAETKNVNKALQKSYPMVPFVKNNICNPYLPGGLPF